MSTIKNYGQAIDFLQVNLGSRRLGGPSLPRLGKTRKDRASGAAARRLTNLEERAAWSREGGTFPGHTCNGHRYRRHVRHAPNTQSKKIA